MAKPPDPELVAILYQAKRARIGLLLQASDRELARTRLYQARAALSDASLGNLQFRISPFGEGDLVIVKGQESKLTSKDLER